jgi:hypothetical protein
VLVRLKDASFFCVLSLLCPMALCLAFWKSLHVFRRNFLPLTKTLISAKWTKSLADTWERRKKQSLVLNFYKGVWSTTGIRHQRNQSGVFEQSHRWLEELWLSCIPFPLTSTLRWMVSLVSFCVLLTRLNARFQLCTVCMHIGREQEISNGS